MISIKNNDKTLILDHIHIDSIRVMFDFIEQNGFEVDSFYKKENGISFNSFCSTDLLLFNRAKKELECILTK